MIQLILFIKPQGAEKAKILEDSLSGAFPELDRPVLRSLPELKARLQVPAPYEDSELYVLIADSNPVLLELFELEEFLNDKRLILVLPNGERDTVALAHRLRPRFVFFLQDDDKDLCAVIEKMIHRSQKACCGSHLKNKDGLRVRCLRT